MIRCILYKYAPDSAEEAQLVLPSQERENILKLNQDSPMSGDTHDSWSEKLPSIRFALNSSKSDTTEHTVAYLQFGRELRTIDDVIHDVVCHDSQLMM
ncbi:reverse transcriptase [Caerostris darwini]|uniref:Reverse transcriptase n=1 Tax=Caerostris darwini TaxID=1538125 RepID=A0AAV4VAW7_9ARAC|nr:reverse transcriptase [Caerostris darwini]